MFRTLLGEYEAYENLEGDFYYLDVKAIPIGVFASVVARIMHCYENELHKKYHSHYILKNDGDFRVVFIFHV